MEITETKKEQLVRAYEVKVPAEIIDAKVAEQIEDYAANARIPGFRRGMMPRDVAAKRFGSALRNEAIKEYVSEVLREIIKTQDYSELASEPQVKTDTSDSKFIKYNISFEIQPVMPNINFETVIIQVNKVELQDTDVERSMQDQFNEDNLKWVPSKKAAKNGDRVYIQYSTKVRNKTLDKDLKTYFIMGKLEKFDNNFIGHSVGEKITFDYEYKPGKTLSYTAEILNIDEASKFEKLDDEYAVARGCKDLEDLKAKTREFLEGKLEEVYETQKIQALRQALLECVPEITPPQTFVNMEAYLLAQEFSAGHIDIPGITPDSTEEERKNAIIDLAVKDVIIGLIVKKVGADFAIKVTEKDLKKLVSQGVNINKSNLREIETRIFEDKVFAKIESLIKIDINTISFKEFEKIETAGMSKAAKKDSKKAPAPKETAEKKQEKSKKTKTTEKIL